MASLRGSTNLWTGTTVAAGGKSAAAHPGVGPYVTIYVVSSVVATFAVEVAVPPNPSAGFNALDGTPDGGLTWFPYITREGHNVTIVTTAGAGVAVDLSPFGPPFLRLHRTDAAGDSVVTAYVSSFGPN